MDWQKDARQITGLNNIADSGEFYLNLEETLELAKNIITEYNDPSKDYKGQHNEHYRKLHYIGKRAETIRKEYRKHKKDIESFIKKWDK